MLTGDWPIRPQPAARLTLDLDICYLRQRYRWVNRLWNINVVGKRPYVASGNPGNSAKGESAFTGGSLASGFLRNDYRNDYRVASRNQSRQSEAKSSQCSCPEGAPGLSIIEGNPLVLSLAFDKLRFSGETLGPGLGKGLVRTVANLTGRGGGVTIRLSATDSEPLLQRLPSSEVGRSFLPFSPVQRLGNAEKGITTTVAG